MGVLQGCGSTRSRVSAYGLQAVEASQATVVANGDPMASVELSTSDVTPFIDDHRQAAFSTTCECYLVLYEGKAAPPERILSDRRFVNRHRKHGFWNAP
jgi:hypothetical protein